MTLVSCKKDGNSDEGDVAFLGGQIINPSDSAVILYKASCIIDTVLLDDNNRFLYKINDLEPSLYTFKHGREIQMVLLEPQDSIMFRLNTMEFDESLVFTGKGAKKNNYLIERFLENEKENKMIVKISQSSPELFQTSLDSLRDIKNKELKSFNAKNKPSKLFNEIAQANIDYNYYTNKEFYPFLFYRNNERQTFETLPKEFYDYRKDIAYDNKNIKDYFPYYRFLDAHFQNLALSEHFKKSSDNSYQEGSLSYTLGKLDLIDSLVTNDDLKNYLLSNTAFDYLHDTKKESDYDAIFKSFIAKSTNESHKAHFGELVNSLKQLKIGSKIPDLKIVDYNNTDIAIQSIINKPTVIYFWNYINKGHFKKSHYRVKELRVKYPEIDFIAINVNDGNHWKKELKQYGFGFINEYQFKNPEQAKHTFAINPINKVILLNKKGGIVNANTNMFTIYFEEQLLGLLNR